jgi:hypothetical protein
MTTTEEIATFSALNSDKSVLVTFYALSGNPHRIGRLTIDFSNFDYSIELLNYPIQVNEDFILDVRKGLIVSLDTWSCFTGKLPKYWYHNVQFAHGENKIVTLKDFQNTCANSSNITIIFGCSEKRSTRWILYQWDYAILHQYDAKFLDGCICEEDLLCNCYEKILKRRQARLVQLDDFTSENAPQHHLELMKYWRQQRSNIKQVKHTQRDSRIAARKSALSDDISEETQFELPDLFS